MHRNAVRRCIVATLATAVGTSVVSSAPAAAPDDTPTAAARLAGIQEPGLAYAGWSAAGTADRPGPEPRKAPSGPRGIDVSAFQGDVDWAGYAASGVTFAYVKATEGTGYSSDTFSKQYNGSYAAGMIRGAYHFALPDRSGGAAQASYFVSRGGGWSGDGRTLPGALDIEYNPYGATCYGLTAGQLVTWVADFSNTYRSLTGRDPVLYTTADWWNQCTGSNASRGTINPLWVARYAATAGDLPAGWQVYTFWQYTSTPLDQDTFNGNADRLRLFATG
jgi:GH25 family lysozyme M1 (1,4-beta-N-acetylmuramidase)